MIGARSNPMLVWLWTIRIGRRRPDGPGEVSGFKAIDRQTAAARETLAFRRELLAARLI
jgi:hypothetical protein